MRPGVFAGCVQAVASEAAPICMPLRWDWVGGCDLERRRRRGGSESTEPTNAGRQTHQIHKKNYSRSMGSTTATKKDTRSRDDPPDTHRSRSRHAPSCGHVAREQRWPHVDYHDGHAHHPQGTTTTGTRWVPTVAEVQRPMATGAGMRPSCTTITSTTPRRTPPRAATITTTSTDHSALANCVASSCDRSSTPVWISAHLAAPHRHAVDHGIDRRKIDGVDAWFLTPPSLPINTTLKLLAPTLNPIATAVPGRCR